MTYPMDLHQTLTWLYRACGMMLAFSYAPQAIAVLRSRQGAQDMSLPTWIFWCVTATITTLYAGIVLQDKNFFYTSLGIQVGCIGVTAATAWRRMTYRKAGLGAQAEGESTLDFVANRSRRFAGQATDGCAETGASVGEKDGRTYGVFYGAGDGVLYYSGVRHIVPYVPSEESPSRTLCGRNAGSSAKPMQGGMCEDCMTEARKIFPKLA